MRILWAHALLIFAHIAVCQQPDTRGRATLYLKDGRVLRCAILEEDQRRIRILIPNGGTYVYDRSDVDSIARSTPAMSDESSTETHIVSSGGGTRPRDRISFAIGLGVAIPVGDFGENEGSKAGFARTGLAASADINIPFNGYLGWISGVSFAVNGLDESGLDAGSAQLDLGTWLVSWSMTGLRASLPVSGPVEVFIFGQLGLFLGASPEITVRSGSFSVTQEAGVAAAFGFAIGAGINISHFHFDVRFQSAEPEYKFQSIGTRPLLFTLEQPTSILQMCVGFGL